MLKNNDKINIEKKAVEFTKDQFLALMKMVYLGNWMANANRTGQDGDPHMKEYDDISDYIFSLAPEFGFSKNFEHDLECDEHGKTTEVNRLHEEYDEENFWDEIIDRLGNRDFYRKYSQEEIKKMSQDDRFQKLYECEDKWADEISENGIERLEIK